MKSNFINYTNTNDVKEQAANRAKSELEGMGVYWPQPDYKLSTIENYERIMAYSQQEAELIVKYLREGAAKPMVLDKVEPKQDWGMSYYDK